jgi:hypothetical protein
LSPRAIGRVQMRRENRSGLVERGPPGATAAIDDR